jgi:hypothetical protein
MAPPDMGNEWTVGYIVNLQGSVAGGAGTAAQLRDDERVVALDPAVGGQNEEAESDREHLAVVGDRLPMELDGRRRVARRRRARGS